MPRFLPFSSSVLLVWMFPAFALAAPPARGVSLDRPPTVVQHKVTRGETLWAISQKHRTSVGAIMDYNHLPDHNVREGMVLRIPPKVVESVPTSAVHHHVHVVRRGEDFWGIAERFRIKASVLAKANPNVNPNRISAGMELQIPVEPRTESTARRDPVAPAPKPTSMTQHTVAGNDTFYSIARKYGVGMDAVVAANPDVRPERLRPGMKVWVPTKSGSAPAPSPGPQPSSIAKTTVTASLKGARTHVIKEDESIASIARKYGVSESALLRENKLTEEDPIYVDDTLKIPGGSAGTTVASNASSPTKPGIPPPKPQSPAPPAPAPTPAPASKPGGGAPANTVGNDGVIRSYIVSAGEDENTICDAFGISKQTLFSYNRLSATTKLKPGDEIAIPRVARGKR